MQWIETQLEYTSIKKKHIRMTVQVFYAYGDKANLNKCETTGLLKNNFGFFS